MAKRAGKRKEKTGGRAKFRRSNPEALKRQREFVDSVTRLAEPLCVGEGLELVHVEYLGEPGRLTLRVYLDKPGGVTLEDCIDISRQLGDILDVHAKDAPPYRLEVSSPGIDRPVGKLKDFIRFTGQRVKILMATAVSDQKNFTGVLAGVVDEMIQIQLDNETISLDFKEVSRARLINYNGER